MIAALDFDGVIEIWLEEVILLFTHCVSRSVLKDFLFTLLNTTQHALGSFSISFLMNNPG
jgi:hypothetical protein